MKIAHRFEEARTILRGVLIPLSAVLLVAEPRAQERGSSVAADALTRATRRVEVLPGLAKSYSGYAFRINDHGQVVGCTTNENGQTHAVLWEPKGTAKLLAIDLGTLGGDFSCAYGVNDLGLVVGESTTATGATHAFLWQDGQMLDLGSLLADPPASPGLLCVARSINDLGQVVGYSAVKEGGYRGFLWQRGTMLDLGSLGPAGDERSQAYDINDRGQIVGWSTLASGAGAVVWNDLIAITLGGMTSEAWGINERGEIVGQMAGSAGTGAFLWQAGLVTMLGGESSIAFGVNAAGQAVGQGISRVDPDTGEQFYGAFLWERGLTSELPRPEVARDCYAYSINVHGNVVGHANTHEFLPLPVIWTSRRSPPATRR